MSSYKSIINGVQRNDRKSQMAFYDLFSRPVFQSAFAILENVEEAEEIMHDTLLKVFSNHNLLHEDALAMTRILKRIAINHAIDVRRKRKEFFIQLDEDWAIEDDMVYDNNLNVEDITIEDIKEEISNLSPVNRSILSLRLFTEMTFSEIAEQLTLNASTVRVQYGRAIDKLRIKLQKKLNQYG